MRRYDLTPEVLVTLAAGAIKPAVAEDMRALIAADPALTDEYKGVQALVRDMGPTAALEFLDDAGTRHVANDQRPGIAPTAEASLAAEEPRKGIVRRLWPYAAALAACLLILLYPFIFPPHGDADAYALALVSAPPQLATKGGDGVPDYIEAFDRGEYVRAGKLVRAAGDTTSRARMVLAFGFLHAKPPQPDSARHYFGRVAAGQGMFRNEALKYAGALALRAGDAGEARRLLAASADQEAAELLRRLNAK